MGFYIPPVRQIILLAKLLVSLAQCLPHQTSALLCSRVMLVQERTIESEVTADRRVTSCLGQNCPPYSPARFGEQLSPALAAHLVLLGPSCLGADLSDQAVNY